MLLIRRGVLDEIQRHALEEYPLECCGLLTGQGNLIETCVRATNQNASGREFFIPPSELFAFFRRLRFTGEEFLGIYHSHPLAEAFPSPLDVENFFYREVSYWIVSLLDSQPDIRCFKWSKMGFEEREFGIHDG
jgi:[CysO sulfur-carrier protein]-S-L-cysteine hydrolase